MKSSRALLLRAALLLALVGVVLHVVCAHAGGVAAVAMAPELAPLLTPLELATGLGAALALAAITCAWQWSSVLDRGERSTPRAVAVLGRLQVAVVVLALYVAVCTVGMSTVLDRRDLGMPGVWLAALVLEVVLVVMAVAVGRRRRWAAQEVAHRQRSSELTPSR